MRYGLGFILEEDGAEAVVSFVGQYCITTGYIRPGTLINGASEVIPWYNFHKGPH